MLRGVVNTSEFERRLHEPPLHEPPLHEPPLHEPPRATRRRFEPRPRCERPEPSRRRLLRLSREPPRIAMLCAGLACATGTRSGPTTAPGHSPRARSAVPSPPIEAARSPSKYPSTTIPLSHDNAYLRRAPAADFWALSPHYVGQQDDVSCSLASLTMLANAARRHLALGSEEPLLTQPLLRRRVSSPVWERGLAPGGDGVTLDELAALARQSLLAAGITPARVEVTHVPAASPEALARLRHTLESNEASGDDWVLLNFYAARYVGTGDYGHIAPVGAYDTIGRRVLVLDPDRGWYEPYWISDKVALDGMATADSVTGEPRGYLYVSACTAASCGRRADAPEPQRARWPPAPEGAHRPR